MPLPILEPMLATTRAPTSPAEWALEPKLDGWRALAYVDERVRVRTRAGRDITDTTRHLAALADIGRSMILDGELVAGAGRGTDFYRLAPRLQARRAANDVSFVIFDVLCLDGVLLTDRPYVERRTVLEELRLVGPGWCTVTSFTTSVRDVFDACAALGVEGVMAKRTDSRYRCGQRSADWIKVKTAEWRAEHGPRRHEH